MEQVHSAEAAEVVVAIIADFYGDVVSIAALDVMPVALWICPDFVRR